MLCTRDTLLIDRRTFFYYNIISIRTHVISLIDDRVVLLFILIDIPRWRLRAQSSDEDTWTLNWNKCPTTRGQRGAWKEQLYLADGINGDHTRYMNYSNSGQAEKHLIQNNNDHKNSLDTAAVVPPPSEYKHPLRRYAHVTRQTTKRNWRGTEQRKFRRWYMQSVATVEDDRPSSALGNHDVSRCNSFHNTHAPPPLVSRFDTDRGTPGGQNGTRRSRWAHRRVHRGNEN